MLLSDVCSRRFSPFWRQFLLFWSAHSLSLLSTAKTTRWERYKIEPVEIKWHWLINDYHRSSKWITHESLTMIDSFFLTYPRSLSRTSKMDVKKDSDFISTAQNGKTKLTTFREHSIAVDSIVSASVMIIHSVLSSYLFDLCHHLNFSFMGTNTVDLL